MAMLFIFLLVVLTMRSSEVRAFQKPHHHRLDFKPGDPRFEFEKMFHSENLMPPPLRFYQNLKDPFKSLEKVFIDYGLSEKFKKADKRPKAIALYAAAHSFDDSDDDQLTSTEWDELLWHLLSSKECQDRLVFMIRHDSQPMAQDGSDPPNPLMQACQLGKNSFIDAAILCFAYNQKHHSPPGSPWKSIPPEGIMSYFIMSHFSNAWTIYNRVVENCTTPPMEDIMSNLVNQRTIFDRVVYNLSGWPGWTFGIRGNPNDIFLGLRHSGAGLISFFRVGNDFFEPNKYSYDGTPKFDRRNECATRAMVLVGARRDANNKVWLLLQNPWAGKRFVEMSFDYLGQCGPIEVFFPYSCAYEHIIGHTK